MKRHLLNLTTLLLVVSLINTVGLSAQELSPDPNAAILKTLKDDGPAKALDAISGLPPQEVADPFLVNRSTAVAAVHRALLQLSSDEQYEILSTWTLAADGSVRVLTALAPESGPPQEFARAIGERPKKESFGTASVGSVPGLFCSAWMLITAADESGNLRKLMTELETRSAKQAAHASFVLALAKIRDSNSVADELRAVLNTRLQDANFSATLAENAVLLAAATQRGDQAETLEPLAEKLIQLGASAGDAPIVTFLRRLRAIAILRAHSPDSDATAILRETPPLWIAVSDPRSHLTATGSDQALWLTHEDHVQKLSGPGNDLLLLRYPLAGTFELKSEVSVFEQGFAGLTYGGMSFDATDKLFTVREVMRPYRQERVWPFVAAREFRMFNRINIRSDGEKVLFLSNLHPGAAYPMSKCSSSPWLGLQGEGTGRLYFRNLEIVGEPLIPREVNLIQDAGLQGWTSVLGQPLRRFVAPLLQDLGAASNQAAADSISEWTVNEGVLESLNVEAPAGAESQRLLAWMRPVLEGETLSYEFFFEEGKSTVHPALGRLAFLLEPAGVRMRWVTTGNDWTGLPPDHGVIEPLNRKGPRTLPLKSGDWNQVSLLRQDGKLQITLNETVVYLRPVAELSSHQPGFYHQADQSTARIRQVKLTGGTTWPERLTADQKKNPVALVPATK